MKITNGSASMIDKIEIEVTSTDIRIGQNSGNILGATILSLGLISGMFLPGAFYFYWIGAIVLCVIAMKNATDTRKRYLPSEIAAMSVLSTDRVGTKGAGGSLGGAAIGAVAFGGVGAIVGSVAGGNKVEEFTNLVIKFTDNEWVTVTSEKGFVGNVQYQFLVKMAGENNQCPI